MRCPEAFSEATEPSLCSCGPCRGSHFDPEQETPDHRDCGAVVRQLPWAECTCLPEQGCFADSWEVHHQNSLPWPTLCLSSFVLLAGASRELLVESISTLFCSHILLEKMASESSLARIERGEGFGGRTNSKAWKAGQRAQALVAKWSVMEVGGGAQSSASWRLMSSRWRFLPDWALSVWGTPFTPF